MGRHMVPHIRDPGIKARAGIQHQIHKVRGKFHMDIVQIQQIADGFGGWGLGFFDLLAWRLARRFLFGPDDIGADAQCDGTGDKGGKGQAGDQSEKHHQKGDS